MDTRFWGPSGWRLLHTATFLYPTAPTPKQKADMREFLRVLPYILPCKFCRHSLTCYYDADPITPQVLRSRGTLTRWLWRIHNQVSGKLRAQNLNPAPNPSFESVRAFYQKWLANPDDYACYLPSFWDFLFSVAYNHPKESSRNSSPMPECPESAFTCGNEKERNKWNTLPYKVRMAWFRRFWKILPAVLGPALGPRWDEAVATTQPNLKNRRTTVAWLWRMRCELDREFKDPYTQVCAKISAYSSDCSKKTSGRAKTCRRRRSSQRHHRTRKSGKTD